MKIKYLALFLLLISSSCFAQNIDSLLVEYYNKAKVAPTDTVLQKKFFDIFPDNFILFNSIYGYNEKSKIQRLYDVSHDHISFFCELHSQIPKNEYYRKIINVGLNGHWDADAVTDLQVCTQTLFLNNIKEAIAILSTYSDSDIKSFWHFFYATPYYDHPFSISFHDEMQKKVKEVNFQAYSIMEEQYQHDYSVYIKNQKR